VDEASLDGRAAAIASDARRVRPPAPRILTVASKLPSPRRRIRDERSHRGYPQSERGAAVWKEFGLACTLERDTNRGGGMARQTKWIVLLAALVAAPGWAADRPGSLADVKVTGTQRVAEARFADATALASRGGNPIDVALAVAGPFEGSTQHIIQVNEGAEAPTASRVTVLRDGLLDDSVRGERWDIALEKTAEGAWRIKEVRRAWRCRRGAQTGSFAATRCP
jgi:hypothetical protein